MEETVGQWWHRWVTRHAYRGYPEHAAVLRETHWARVYRVLSGNVHAQLSTADARPVKIARSATEKIAGSGKRYVMGEVHPDRLILPPTVDAYPSQELNELAYRWMVLIAAHWPTTGERDWRLNPKAVRTVLTAYPHLHQEYRRLCDAERVRRPDDDVAFLAPDFDFSQQIDGDSIIRHLPVAFWLYPSTQTVGSATSIDDVPEQRSCGDDRVPTLQQRKKARRIEQKQDKGGLMAFRLESMFTWEEFTPVDRTEDDTEDNEAASVANDMEQMAISRSRSQSMASRIKLDLDLPAEANDDVYLGDGIVLPEWDYKQSQLVEEGCILQAMLARDSQPMPLPDRLRPMVKRIQQQYQRLMPEKRRLFGQQEGDQADLDRYLQHWVERQGRGSCEDRFYVQHRPCHRDFATLLLADLSFSTDTYVNNSQRVIDVIQDSMLMMGEALNTSHDRFAMYGFSSKKRQMVRYHCLKNFNEPYSADVRGRVLATRPGFYTRMGAALRQSTKILAAQPQKQRLLLLISDGKPNDLDVYEGRYGLEDTHQAVIEARKQGVRPFCITIDQQAEDYLPYLFGHQGFVVISKPETLPKRLPVLYAQLTAGG